MHRFAKGIRFAERALQTTFNYKGATYPCSGSTLAVDGKLQVGGVDVEYDGDVLVRLDLFPAGPPKRKERVTYLGNEMRIAHTEIDQLGVSIRLYLVNPSRGV
jgi:hypothetical protein